MRKLNGEQKRAVLDGGEAGHEKCLRKSKSKTGLKWWERLLWVTLAGAAYAASALLGGCGHNVDFTQDRTEVCKSGSCLVIKQGHISRSQVHAARRSIS